MIYVNGLSGFNNAFFYFIKLSLFVFCVSKVAMANDVCLDFQQPTQYSDVSKKELLSKIINKEEFKKTLEIDSFGFFYNRFGNDAIRYYIEKNKEKILPFEALYLFAACGNSDAMQALLNLYDFDIHKRIQQYWRVRARDNGNIKSGYDADVVYNLADKVLSGVVKNERLKQHILYNIRFNKDFREAYLAFKIRGENDILKELDGLPPLNLKSGCKNFELINQLNYWYSVSPIDSINGFANKYNRRGDERLDWLKKCAADGSASAARDLAFLYITKNKKLFIKYYNIWASNIWKDEADILGINKAWFVSPSYQLMEYLEKLIPFRNADKNEWFKLTYRGSYSAFIENTRGVNELNFDYNEGLIWEELPLSKRKKLKESFYEYISLKNNGYEDLEVNFSLVEKKIESLEEMERLFVYYFYSIYLNQDNKPKGFGLSSSKVSDINSALMGLADQIKYYYENDTVFFEDLDFVKEELGLLGVDYNNILELREIEGRLYSNIMVESKGAKDVFKSNYNDALYLIINNHKKPSIKARALLLSYFVTDFDGYHPSKKKELKSIFKSLESKLSINQLKRVISNYRNADLTYCPNIRKCVEGVPGAHVYNPLFDYFYINYLFENYLHFGLSARELSVIFRERLNKIETYEDLSSFPSATSMVSLYEISLLCEELYNPKLYPFYFRDGESNFSSSRVPDFMCNSSKKSNLKEEKKLRRKISLIRYKSEALYFYSKLLKEYPKLKDQKFASLYYAAELNEEIDIKSRSLYKDDDLAEVFGALFDLVKKTVEGELSEIKIMFDSESEYNIIEQIHYLELLKKHYTNRKEELAFIDSHISILREKIDYKSSLYYVTLKQDHEHIFRKFSSINSNVIDQSEDFYKKKYYNCESLGLKSDCIYADLVLLQLKKKNNLRKTY